MCFLFSCGGGGGTGGGGTGGGGTGGGFSNVNPRIIRPERKSEVYSFKCDGLRAMWEYSFRNNDAVLTKEMAGFLTTTGKIIILPSYDNFYNSVSFKGSYLDEQGREIVRVYEQQGKLKVDLISYTTGGQYGDSFTYEIDATIHTHPYTNNLFDTYNPSNPDKNLASNYSSVKNYILTYDKLIEYNNTGVINTSNHNCP